jgi:hypothetical protein
VFTGETEEGEFEGEIDHSQKHEKNTVFVSRFLKTEFARTARTFTQPGMYSAVLRCKL